MQMSRSEPVPERIDGTGCPGLSTAKARFLTLWATASLSRRAGSHPVVSRPAWRCVAVLAILLIVSTGTLPAAEPWRPFIEGLRQRRLHDMALVYLKRMAADPDCPADLKEVIDYEAGITLLTGSRGAGLVALQEQALDDARGRFEKFLAAHPNHEMASLATSQLANVLVERGRIRAARAERSSTLPEQKEKLLAEARQFYAEARAAFAKAEERYIATLKDLRAENDRGKLLDERDQARHNLILAKMYQAGAIRKIAVTYPDGDRRRNENLNESAKRYHAIYDAYYVEPAQKQLTGLYARLWEGCCYKELGQHQRALSIFDEVLTRPGDVPPIRQLKTKTLVAMLETLLGPEVKEYASATEMYHQWEKNVRGSDESSADGLAVKYYAAEAYLERARRLEKGNPKRSELRGKARRLLRSVARFSGDYQAKAKVKLLDPLLKSAKAGPSEPADFAEARDRADAAKDRMQAVALQDRPGQEQGKKKDRDRTQKQIAEEMREAIRYYRMALTLATPETPVDELNVARYYLAYLYWRQHDQYEAAVLGEFLARRYSGIPLARPAAQIAMLAYAELYNRSPAGPSKEFARERMMAMADHVTRRWPTSPEAGDAWITLIETAVIDEDIAAALGYLEKLPADSPRRGEAEVMLGRACWVQWLRAIRRDDADRPGADVLEGMLARARSLLASGVNKVASDGQVDALFVAAELALAKIYLHQNKPAEAARLLEAPGTGVLALVQAGHPASTGPGYDVEIYKTALRAYVATQELGKAEEIMDALEKSVAAGGDARSASRLTEVYIGLGRELQNTLQLLRQQRRADDLKKVSRSFELFLNRISQRKQGNTFNSLAWVAGTSCDMAARFDAGGKTLPPEAEKYYRQAAEIYEKILKRCGQQPRFAPSDGAVDGVRVRLARCLRRLGRFDEAMKLLVDVLARRNRMVDAQVEAAYTYQQWAATRGNAKKYLHAIQGGRRAWRKDGSRVNVVWGWAKLGNLVLRGGSRMATFHEARYNLARCRFEYALTLSGKEKKAMLAQAEKDIMLTELLSPKLGGADRRGQYDALLRRIQDVQGKEPTGLKTSTQSARK